MRYSTSGTTCMPANDAGQCPAGSQWFACPTPSGRKGGCIEVHISPNSASHCEPIPAACGSVIDCSCVECTAGVDFCSSVSGHEVICVSAGP